MKLFIKNPINSFFKLTCAKKLACVFVLLTLIFGTAIIILNPPFVSPDENSHFPNVCRISHGNFFVDIHDGSTGSYLTAEELDFYKNYSDRYHAYEEPAYSFSEMRELAQRPISSEMEFVKLNSSTLNPFSYLLPGLFLMILRGLGLSINAFFTVMIGKFVNLTFYALVTGWAISKTRALPKTMFLLALMPMSIYQGASLSYDSPLIACTFLLFAYLTKILTSDESTKVCREDFFAICFVAFFIAASKFAYILLLAVLFTIPLKKFASLKQYFLCIGSVAAIIAVAYAIPTLVITQTASQYQPPLTEAQILQREYFYANVWEFPRILYNTVDRLGEWYASSFFGLLGRVSVSLPIVAEKIFYALLFVFAIVEISTVSGIRWYTKAVSIICSAIIVLGTALAMFLEHTPLIGDEVRTDMIWGIQGRYFIPLAVFIIVVFASPVLLRFKHTERVQKILGYAVAPVTFVYFVVTVLALREAFWLV